MCVSKPGPFNWPTSVIFPCPFSEFISFWLFHKKMEKIKTDSRGADLLTQFRPKSKSTQILTIFAQLQFYMTSIDFPRARSDWSLHLSINQIAKLILLLHHVTQDTPWPLSIAWNTHYWRAGFGGHGHRFGHEWMFKSNSGTPYFPKFDAVCSVNEFYLDELWRFFRNE